MGHILVQRSKKIAWASFTYQHVVQNTHTQTWCHTSGETVIWPARATAGAARKAGPNSFAVMVTQCIGPQQNDRRLRAHGLGFEMHVHTSSLAYQLLTHVCQRFSCSRPTMQRVRWPGCLSCRADKVCGYLSTNRGGTGWKTQRALKATRCSSLRGGGGELGTLKFLTYDSNQFAQNLN